MKLQIQKNTGRLAFSMVEVLVAMSIIGILFVSMYGGISSGFAVVHSARETMRANQLMLEKMETIRLYTWEQINSNGFVAPTFSASFYPLITNEYSNPNDLRFYGTVAITAPGVSDAYSTNMRKVVVTLNWTNGGISHSRQMETLVSEYGMQNYIY